MCNCDAEFKPQPVAVYNVVTHPPTDTNHMTSDNAEDTESEVADSVLAEDPTENTNNPTGCEFASYLHTIGVYVGRFECILCIAYSHSHTY